MSFSVSGEPKLNGNVVTEQDFDAIVSHYKCAENVIKCNRMRKYWTCPRCRDEEKKESICRIYARIDAEQSGGINSKVCGTCAHNQNNINFTKWEIKMCEKGSESRTPCQICKCFEDGWPVWKAAPPSIVHELLGNIFKFFE